MENESTQAGGKETLEPTEKAQRRRVDNKTQKPSKPE